MPGKMERTFQRQPFICLHIKLQRKLIKAFRFNLGSVLKCSIAKSPKEYAYSVPKTWAARPEKKNLGVKENAAHLPGTGGEVLGLPTGVRLSWSQWKSLTH